MIGSKIKQFASSFHIFTDGPLAVAVERFGGIDSVKLLDSLQLGGKYYPDRDATPVFSKNNFSVDRPLYGPAIRFLKRDGDGQETLLYPETPELLPFGLHSETYDLLLDRQTILIEFPVSASAETQFITAISKLHSRELHLNSLKNQLVDLQCDWGIRRLPPEYRGEDFDPSYPFADGGMELTILHSGFDAATNCWQMAFNQKFAYADKQLHVCIRLNTPCQCTETPNQWILSGIWPQNHPMRFVLALAETQSEAEEKAGEYLEHGDFFRQQKIAIYDQIARNAPKLRIENMPLAGEFARVAPLWQNAMLLDETDHEACIRAAGNKFGFFMMWDHIYPIRDFLTQGRPDVARKMLRYVIDYPHTHTCIWASTHFILALNEYLAFCDDDALLAEAWTLIRKFRDFSRRFADQETGLVLTGLGVGVDNPAEIGLGGLFFASCINGWYHGACRATENLAIRIGDRDTEMDMRGRIEKLEHSFLSAFYDTLDGYLYAGIGADKKVRRKIYQNTNTIALDYPYGRFLLREVATSLAEFQRKRLSHPTGRVAVPFDSAADCEMWRYVHMNQHLGHECKLQRHAGDTQESYRVMAGYLAMFDETKVAVETFNLSGCFGDEIQRADWQTFSATGAYHALLHGLAGIGWHRGGLFYEPAPDNRKIELKNFAGVDITIDGEGRYVGQITLDGKLIAGSLQLPVDLLNLQRKTSSLLHITRSNQFFDRPTLLQAVDMAITDLQSTEERLQFTVANEVRSPLLLALPYPCKLFINNQEVPVNLTQKLQWLDLHFHADDRVDLLKR